MKKIYLTNFKNCKFFIVLFCIFFSLSHNTDLFGQTVVSFPATTTWTCPDGVSSITVQCWGSGGAGGSARANNGSIAFALGGGGSGGAYATTAVSVVPGTIYTVTVGTAVTGTSSTTDNTVVNGNPSWFSTASTVYAQGGAGGVSRYITTNITANGAGGTGSSAASIGTTLFKGGDGGTPPASTSTVPGGGGGGSGGTALNGNPGTSAGVGGTAVAGGGAGGAGRSNTSPAFSGTVPGGGGGGARSSSTSQISGGTGAAGQVTITYTQLTYIVQNTLLNTGAANWCAGETRNVTFTVKNVGTATWTSSGVAPVNQSYWWSNQSGQDANPRLNPFAGLAPGQSQNISIPITAPVTPGSYTLNFDLVVEGFCWFRNNALGCSGPGNPTFVSPTITVNAVPGPPTGTAAQSFCTINNPTVANLAATGTTILWYAASTGGTALATSTPLVSSTHYYASQTSASGCESATRFDVTATISNPAAPTGTAAQSFCTINTPTVANLLATGTVLKWYSVATGGTALVSTTALVNATHYYASQTVAGCESALRFDVTATVGNPAAPTGTAAQSFCTINTPTVANLLATGTAVQWYSAATGGTALASTTSLVNATHYYASQTLAGCESALRFDVTATVGNPAAPTGTAAQSFCTINTPIVANLLATGTALKWYSVATGGTALVSTTSLVNATHYYASQTLAGCESALRFDVTATVGNPAAPTGSAAQSFCTINTPTVANLLATGTTVQWYSAPTGGTALISTTSLVNATHYYASQTVSGCESALRLDVTVTVSNPAAPTGNSAQLFCAINTPTIADIVISATAPKWYTTSTGGTAIVTTTPLADGTTYYTSQTLSGCESATRLAVAVTVGNPAAPTGTTSQLFCADANPKVADLSATGSLIQWYTAVTGGTALATSTALIDGTHYYASQTVSGCESALRLDVTATIYQPVIITTSPASGPQTVCGASTVTYTVVATGSGLTYQWFKDGTLINNGGTISGATTTTLKITGAQLSDAGDYTVVVSGLSPCASANTNLNPATLIVDQRAVFTAQPLTPQTICEGQSYTISARATGTIVTYKWNKIGFGYYADAVFDGVDKYTLIIPTVTPGDAGSYQLVLDDGTTGCTASNSNVAVLIVNPTPVATISGTATVCQSSLPAPFITFINPNALPVTITYNINLGTNLTVNVNANTSVTIAALTGTAGTFDYNLVSVAYQSGPGCSNLITGTATITVSPTPDVVATPASQSMCSGDAITAIALSGSVVPTTFNWTRDNASVTGIATSGSGDINGSLTNATNAPITVTFTITPTAAGCVGTAITATVLVNPTSSVNTVSNQTVCNNTATTAISFTSATTGGTIVYNWTNSAPSIGLAASGAGNIASFTATNASTAPVTATITVTPSYTNGATCPGTRSTFTITVNPVTTVNTVSNQTVCKNTATTAVTFASPTTGGTIIYNWTNNTPSVGLAASGVGNIPSFTATNITGAPVIATVTVTPSYTNGATCAGTPITFTITVNPAATVNTVSNQTVCNNTSTTAITFSSPTTGGTIVYNWTNNAPSIGLAVSGAGNIAAFTATNAGTAPVTATITVTPSYTNGATCPGTPSTFTITVNPTATVTTVSNNTFCNNTASGAINFTSPTTGGTIVYNWTNNTPSIGLAASGAGNIASFTATNAGTAPVTATITVTPSYTNGATCPGTAITFTITVNPAATVNTVPNQTLCKNTATTAVTFGSPTTGGTIVYNWTNNAPSIGLAASGAGNIASFTATNITSAPVTATITVTPSYTNGATCPGTPITFTITVNPAATVNTVSNQTLCNNTATTAVTFSSPTTGGTIVYNWTNNTPSIGLAASGAGNIASFTATNAGTAPVTATITVTPSYTNGATCPGTASTFTITVNPVATVNTVSNQTVCKNTAITAVTFGSPTTGGTIVYNWTNNAPSIGLAASGAGNIASFTATNITGAPVIATITVTPSYTNGATCAGTPITFTITVNPAATVNTVSNQTLCNNTATTAVTFSSPTTGGTIVYNWTNNALSIGLAASGTGDIASFTATNPGTAPVVATITVTPSYTNGATCAGTPSTFTITVNPTPNSIATPLSQTKCSGIAITTIVLSTSATPAASTTYTWTRNNTATVTGIAASGSGNISGTLTNTTAAPVLVTFTIIPTYSGGCVGTATTATVLVNPKPTAGNITAASTVCIGSTITLTPAGSGIGTLTYVWISSTPSVAKFVSAANGVLTGVGTGTTQITYTVTDANGCSSATSPAFAVTVTKPTANAISTTANPANSVCVNSTIQLTSNATGTGTLTYTWASSDNTKATVNNSGLVTGVAAGTINITYTVTDANGCSTTSAPYSVTILGIPTGTLAETDNSGIANNDKIICAGASATFTFSVPGLGSYVFKVNGVQKQSGPSNIFSSITLNDGDNITVDVANASNCGATFGPILMTVKQLPNPILTVTPSTTICPNDPVTLTTSANAGSTYSFIINGSIVSTGPSNTYTTTAIATTSTVAIMETNSNGCQATTANQTITVSPLPSGTLAVSPGASFCAGTPVTFTASAVIGNTYNFKIGSTSVQNSNSNTYTTTTLANGDIITVVVTNAAGCSVTFNAIAVTANQPPTGTLNAFENSGTQNDNSICANAPVTFTFSNTTYSAYNFKVGGVSKQNNGTASYINSTLISGDIVTVVVTSGSGCVATFTAPVITIVPSPSVTLSASPTTICAGDNVTFTATPLDPTYNYNFQVNATTVQNGTTNTYSSTSIASTDVVTVDVTNSNSCTTTSNSVSIAVTPLPIVVTHDQTVCAPATVDLTVAAVIAGSTPNLSFSYFTDPGGTLVYSTPTTAGSGTYYIKGTTAGGCSAISPVTVTVNPLPVVAAITPAGPVSVCQANTITLSDVTTGGVWSSLNTGVATIDASGVVTGVSAGTATINYTITNITTGCSNTASALITVNAPPTVAPITGNFNVCTGSTSQLSDATAGGIWTSGNMGFATVDASGLVTGVAPGNAIISYSFTDPNGCTTVVTATVTVANSPTVATITPATPNICVGSAITLSDATTGGVWSSGTTTIATITSSGVVTGIASGTSIITYTITTSCGGTASASTTVTVNAPPSATITYPGSPFCSSSAPVPVTQSGTTGGTYSASPGGLSLAANGTITPSTSTAGTYTVTYTVAASGGCAIYATTATVTITAVPSATIAYGASPYCSNGGTAAVTRTGTAGGTYTKTAGAGTLSLNSATGDITLGTSTPGLYTVTYTVAASGGCSIFTTTASVTITAAPSATIAYSGSPYCSSGGTATVTRTGTPGGSYTKTAGAGTLSLNSSTGDITLGTSTPGLYTVTYTVTASAGCAIYTTTANVTITAAPTAIAGTAIPTCSNSPAVNITAGSSATNYSSVLWTSSGTGTFTNAASLTLATYAPSAADISAGVITLTLTANGNGNCGPVTSTKTLTIFPPPPAFVITPSGTVNVCQGNVQPLTATATTSTSSFVTVPSGTINLTIPDAQDFFFFVIPGSVTTNLNVSTVPAGAVINSISVNFTITHPYDDDLVLNLKAPNGKVLNLVDQKGQSGDNFTNTTVSSAGTNPFLNNAINAPFTGTFVADGDNGVGTPISGNNVFSNLFSIPNGTWTFGAEDDGPLDQGKIVNWSITINYTIPASPIPVTWSPLIDLYTDAGATATYTGTTLSTVYAKPSSAGTKVYTATATNAANCSTSQNVTLNVGTSPVVTVAADYCAVAGKVQLTANSTPAAISYLWSTGETTQTILVDVSGIYTVTVYSAGSTCPGKGTINVANELVYNGNFELGNVGFTSAYPYRTTAGSLNNPPGYAVDTAANYYGPTFLWGKDHTTTHGKFMMVNGAAGPNYQIWQQTISVLPNTIYYFSAWGLELDNLPSPPTPANAQLQFNVNGAQVGTLGNLPRPVNPTRDQDNNTWVRFYGSWTSGPTTTSVLVSITDLQGAVYGNNFGLDDISFGTLSTFVELVSAPGTDAQTVCANNPITNIVYSAGSSASSPTVTGLPTGVTPSWNGVYLTISGTPTVAGNYAYTVTTTGSCQPASASGTITVQAQKITLSSGSSSPTVCTNNPVNIGYTISGTATGATASGLAAAGLTLTVAGTTTITATITGTPSVAGSYPYTITTTGTCTAATISGTITVQSQTLALNSGNSTQTVCINSPIANIQYTVGAPGNNASVNILPAGSGLVGNYAGGLFVISGTPMAAGTFNYTVTTTGTSCASATATGTITVTPAASLTLTSATGTNAQTVCKPNPITPVTYSINGGTGATVTGLPAGVTGSPSGSIFTISGTPTAAPGSYNYTITTNGGCGAGTATGSITIQAPTITLTSGSASPSVCINTPMPTNIVYTIGGTATGATVTGLPGGVGFGVVGNVVTISGTPNASGPFIYTVSTTGGTCTQATATGTITVIPTAIGGTLASVSICSGTSGTLNLSGNSSNPIRWEYSTDGGVTWTTVANTTISLTTPALTSARMYRAVVGNTCGTVFSTVATVGIHNLWVGGTSNDWNTASNWSDNLVPGMSCPAVTIPVVSGPNVYPVLSTGAIATINNLVINAGASLTVTGNTMQIAGSITSTGASFDASTGKIELNGGAVQTIAAATFMTNKVQDLVINNTAGVVLNGAVDVYRSLTYGAANAKLTTGGFLTLKSTATETAWVGDMTNHIITGNVTVERYIATGAHAKSWQLLAIPTQGQTIKAAWQEGATVALNTTNGNTPFTNPKPGYGTMLTSDVANAAIQPTPGFDLLTTPGPSIKVYNAPTDTYIGPANTGLQIYDQKGYFTLVRGDRSVFTSGGAAVPTILRTKGTLFTPANLPPLTTVIAGKFESVGNPYASAIDLRSISNTAQDFFIVWDPKLGGAYGLGGFVTLSRTGADYFATPQSPSYGSGPQDFIQSGQAFIVQAFGSNGTISFKENDKASGSSLVNRPMRDAELQSQLHTNLYGINAGGTYLADGTLIQYNDTYSNSIDGLDARKMINTGENLAIKSAGSLLVIERRQPIAPRDTIFLNLTGVRAQQYQFQFEADKLNAGVEGFLEDNYLHTKTPVSLTGSTTVNFTIENIAGSYAPDRFRIVFAPSAVLPVTFTSLKAYREDKNIQVEWRVENETNMKQYEVEKSTNGIQFTTLTIKAASANGGRSAIYVTSDVNPPAGYNYYRIKSVDINGKTAYTNIVKVLMGSSKQDITIVPNPITDGMIHLQLMNQPEGKYGLRLLDKLGQVIVSRQISHVEGSSTELIKWDYNLAHGMYQLEVTKPDGSVKDINVLY